MKIKSRQQVGLDHWKKLERMAIVCETDKMTMNRIYSRIKEAKKITKVLRGEPETLAWVKVLIDYFNQRGVIHNDFFAELLRGEHDDLLTTKGRVLGALQGGRKRPREIATALKLTPATVKKALSKLESENKINAIYNDSYGLPDTPPKESVPERQEFCSTSSGLRVNIGGMRWAIRKHSTLESACATFARALELEMESTNFRQTNVTVIVDTILEAD